MILSNRNGLKNTRNMLRVFGGLNETYSCTEAEYSAGINFSARNFPALSTRLPRRKLREEADLNGMYHLNGLLTVCGRDLVYTPDDTDEMEVTLKDAVEDGRKTLVGIGTRILIFPDKLAFDTASREVSALGAVWSGKNTSVEFAPCDAEGKIGLPHLSENMDAEDARAIRNYLYQMQEQLQYVLCNLDVENMSEPLRARLNSIQ